MPHSIRKKAGDFQLGQILLGFGSEMGHTGMRACDASAISAILLSQDNYPAFEVASSAFCLARSASILAMVRFSQCFTFSLSSSSV